jgi:hypothetical protein
MPFIKIDFWIVDDDFYEGRILNRNNKLMMTDARELGELIYKLFLLY